MKLKEVPQGLRIWFLVHFVADLIFAIPLIFFPDWIFGLFGFTVIEPTTSRLLGAGLIGIGGASLFAYKKGKESFDILLTLKILWSLSAILILLFSIIDGAPKTLWLITAIFTVFSSVWIYYKIKLQ